MQSRYAMQTVSWLAAFRREDYLCDVCIHTQDASIKVCTFYKIM